MHLRSLMSGAFFYYFTEILLVFASEGIHCLTTNSFFRLYRDEDLCTCLSLKIDWCTRRNNSCLCSDSLERVFGMIVRAYVFSCSVCFKIKFNIVFVTYIRLLFLVQICTQETSKVLMYSNLNVHMETTLVCH